MIESTLSGVNSFVAAFHRSYALRILAGFVAAAFLLTALGLVAKAGDFQPADDSIRNYVETLESPWLTNVLVVVTRFGSTLFLTLIGVLLLLAFACLRWWKAAGLFLLGMIGQAVLHLGFKAIFNIQRPQALLDYVVGDTPSFPSGHALASTAFYGLAAFLITRRIKSRGLSAAIWILSLSLILAIGFSRIYFGVHHASDVVAGFLAAATWVAAVASGERRA
jgi:undecaprenyl-diphosphatase